MNNITKNINKEELRTIHFLTTKYYLKIIIYLHIKILICCR